MFKTVFDKIIGTYSDRQIKKIKPIVTKIEDLETEISKLSDHDLRQKTAYFKEKIANGASLNDILPEVFAVIREASHRVLGMKHFSVQLLGGIVLHQGRIAEMKTGEGKTLVSTLPAYLNSLTGKGVHIVTVNDYLAKRDSEWMGKIYKFLDVSVGLIVHDVDPRNRKTAYDADITYGTNNEFGFDYLRDNMVIHKPEMVQRGHNFCIVDEVDSILIDEARTPLIISGAGDKSTDLYEQAENFVKGLKYIKFAKTDNDEDIDEIEDYDYVVDEKSRSATLTVIGIKRAEERFGLENLSDVENITLNHHIQQALKAHGIMKRDRDYVVKNDEVIIVDEFTGRLMFGRRYNDGLHQAIEAKEGAKVEAENRTLATITFQNYFRMYDKLSGMTGTALTEEDEFQEIYHLDVVSIPTNQPIIRKDHNDLVYKNEAGKFKAVVRQIQECHLKGQPVLVGTISIDKSEILSQLLRQSGVPHNVLNAKFHEQEAEIISQAGKKGSVTIATNMAGRGTDIMLGGNPDFMALNDLKHKVVDENLIREATSYAETEDEAILEIRKNYQELLQKYKNNTDITHDEVVQAGGLFIVGTERHESRRIDNQLRGRSGRQGDAGESKFFLSLEDDLMRMFADRAQKLFNLIGGLDEDEPLEAKMLSKTIEGAQQKVEMRNFNTRKYVVQYDDVINKQREIIYRQRLEVLENHNLKNDILNYVEAQIKDIVSSIAGDMKYADSWNWESLIEQIWDIFNTTIHFTDEERKNISKSDLIEKIKNHLFEIYNKKEEEFTPDGMRELERVVLLQVVDQKWIDHIDSVEHLKNGIGLRAYGQRDPIVEFKFETMSMFENMIHLIRKDTVKHIYHAVPTSRIKRIEVADINHLLSNADLISNIQSFENPDVFSQQEVTPIKLQNIPLTSIKEKRNELCSCGSGLKYKKCCGLTSKIDDK